METESWISTYGNVTLSPKAKEFHIKLETLSQDYKDGYVSKERMLYLLSLLIVEYEKLMIEYAEEEVEKLQDRLDTQEFKIVKLENKISNLTE